MRRIGLVLKEERDSPAIAHMRHVRTERCAWWSVDASCGAPAGSRVGGGFDNLDALAP